MDERHNRPTHGIRDLAPKDAVEAAGRLCAAFSHASALGFAILDEHLRYQAINEALVAINGFSAAEHVGKTIRDLFGNDVADQIEPRVERLVATGSPSVFELHATLPTRSAPGSWIDHYFPIKGAAGKMMGVGLVVVEVTEQRKLDEFISQLTSELLRDQSANNWWLARELHESIEEYHLALQLSIGDLIGKPQKSPELLAQAVESLDERIRAIQELVTVVARGFPI